MAVTRDLLGAAISYTRMAWWGLVAPRLESDPLVVLQAVVVRETEIGAQVLLSVREDLRGWELPGGQRERDEDDHPALVREVREETGLDVRVLRPVGDYVRTGFRPHIARVHLCEVVGGRVTTSDETPLVRWFSPDMLPSTLFPWYRAPLADAFAEADLPRLRREHHGLPAIVAGLSIDLRMRLSGNRAGSEGGQSGSEGGQSGI